MKLYRSVFFLDVFISFCSTSKYYQTIWKLIWLTIRLIHENSWLPSSVGHDIHMRTIDYFGQPGYNPNNCNGVNSTSERFRTPYVTVLYKRNWISRRGRFHRLSTPLLSHREFLRKPPNSVFPKRVFEIFDSLNFVFEIWEVLHLVQFSFLF